MSYNYSTIQRNGRVTQSTMYEYTFISKLFLWSSCIRSKKRKSEYQAKLERGFKQMEEGRLQYHDLIEDDE